MMVEKNSLIETAVLLHPVAGLSTVQELLKTKRYLARTRRRMLQTPSAEEDTHNQPFVDCLDSYAVAINVKLGLLQGERRDAHLATK